MLLGWKPAGGIVIKSLRGQPPGCRQAQADEIYCPPMCEAVGGVRMSCVQRRHERAGNSLLSKLSLGSV